MMSLVKYNDEVLCIPCVSQTKACLRKMVIEMVLATDMKQVWGVGYEMCRVWG